MGFEPLHRIPDVKSLERWHVFKCGRHKAAILVVGASLRVSSYIVDGFEEVDGSIGKLLFGIYFYRARKGCIGHRSNENPTHIGNNQVVFWKITSRGLLTETGQDCERRKQED